MAIPIKQVPILSGEIAEDFFREAEEKNGNWLQWLQTFENYNVS